MKRKQKKSWIPKSIKNIFNRTQQLQIPIKDSSEQIRNQYMKLIKIQQNNTEQQSEQQQSATIYEKPPEQNHSTNAFIMQKLKQQEDQIQHLQAVISSLQQLFQDTNEFKQDVTFQLAQTKTNINMVYDNQVMLKDQLDQQQELLQYLEQTILSSKLAFQSIENQEKEQQPIVQERTNVISTKSEVQSKAIQQQENYSQQEQNNNEQDQQVQTQKEQEQINHQPVINSDQIAMKQNEPRVNTQQQQQSTQCGFQNFKPVQSINQNMSNGFQQQAQFAYQQNSTLNIQQQLQSLGQQPQQSHSNIRFQDPLQTALNQTNKFSQQPKKQVQIKFDDNFIGQNKKNGKQK